MWKNSLPLYKVMAGVGLSFIAMLGFHMQMFGAGLVWTINSLLWIMIGAFYTHFFEYFYHRVPMHHGIRGLLFLRNAHDIHHQVFYGSHFQQTVVRDPQTLISRWWVFPPLFVVHYCLALLILPRAHTPLFFIGVCFHYVIFELSHWFTHLKDNWYDKIMLSIPLISWIRRKQILHHRIHHQFLLVRFNFTPPYLGDRIFRTMDPKRFIRKINNSA